MTKIRAFQRRIIRPSYNCGRNYNNNETSEIYPNQHLLHRGKLAKSSVNDEYVDSQFVQPPIRVPTKAILLATFLFIFGTFLLFLAIMSIVKDSHEKIYLDRVIPLLLMGTVMFIPGFYHVRIAYLAFLGVAGYTFDDIPEFD